MTPRQPIFALVDCNNFFVSCERAFRPDLWHKPVAVLSNNDGCIVARSNEVKALEVPMGVPLFKVQHIMKQHDVTLFSANFSLYGDFSQRVVQILQEMAPSIEVYSVDESFLEVSGLSLDSYEGWAREVRQRIAQWTGIPVSIGVAPSKTLAKAAAEFAKHHPETGGILELPRGDQAKQGTLLKWLPIKDVWGIGWRTAPKLQQRGISTAYDLSKVSEAWAHKQLSIRGLKTVKELKGESCIALEKNGEPQQSIACTRSFGHNVRDYYQLEGAIATFTARAAAKLRAQNEVAAGIAVFLRTPQKFEGGHGSSTLVRLAQPGADTGQLISAAVQGLQTIYDPDFAYKKGGVVLVGLSSHQAWQLSLLQDPKHVDRQVALMQAVDHINTQFGTRLVRHASEHLERTEWHSLRRRRSPAYTTRWQELPIVKV